MGQKVNPIGLRVGINRTWDSRWYADGDYADLLHEDVRIRKFLKEKLSQAGVAKIVIVDAERSVVRWDAQRRERGRARLERIVTSAVEQSRRVHMPVLRGPVPAAEVLSAMPIAEPGGRAIRSDDVALAIGPEGGWSDAERAAASDMVDLGAGVLRVETAALVAATLMLVPGQRQ